MGPALASPLCPHGVVTGKTPGRKEIRLVADGWGPHVSGCGGVAVVSGLAGRVGPKGLGGP
jgi:hypothetical protein